MHLNLGGRMSGILSQVENELLKEYNKEHTSFRVGDTIKVTFKVTEGGKERLQRLEGIVMKMENPLHRKSFTMRRISGGVGMEITMQLHSPKIQKIEVTIPAKRKARRAKLYYLRGRVGKKASTV